MKLDQILEFLFRRIGGVIVTGVCAVLCVLSLSGCLCVDCFTCLCTPCNACAADCSESCNDCTDGGDCFSCEYCLLCFSGSCIETSIDGCIANMGNPEVVGTYGWIDYYGNTQTATLYEGHSYYTVSHYDVPFMEFVGFFSGPDGTGIQYTDGIYVIGDVYPTNGSVIYPHYIDVLKDLPLYIKVTEYDVYYGNVYDSYTLPIEYGGDITEVLPYLLKHNQMSFVGWSVEISESKDYLISQGNEIFEEYTSFIPQSYPSRLLTNAYTEYRDGVKVAVFNLYAVYSVVSASVTVVDTVDPENNRSYSFSPPATLATLYPATYNHEGYAFVGLFYDEAGTLPCDMDANLYSDLTVYAVYKPASTLLFYDDTGETKLYEETYVIGEYVTLPTPQKPGYEFVGWQFEDTDKYGNATFVDLNVSATHTYARLRPVWQTGEYKITYVVNGKELVVRPSDAIYYFSEGKSLIEGDPAAWGEPYYTFGGWYTDSEFTGSATTEISSETYGDLIFYARLIPIQILIYGDDFLGNTYTVTANYGEYFTMPIPERPHYTFLGWYIMTNEVVTSEGVSKSELLADTNGITASDIESGYVTLFASWEKTHYTIEYLVDGETFYKTTRCYQEELPTPTDIPEKQGYTFRQWLLDGEPVTNGTTVTGNMTFTADFEENTYYITLVFDNGSENGVISYKHGERVLTGLPIPTKEGHTFTGWLNESGAPVMSKDGTPYPNFEWDKDGYVLYARWSDD